MPERIGKDGWLSRKDAWIRPADGATIHGVKPRGLLLYALRMPGSKSPTWHEGLGEAKRHANQRAEASQ